MRHLLRWLTIAGTMGSAGCVCEEVDVQDVGSGGGSDSGAEASSGSSSSSSSGEDGTGAPFDTSRWVGRYHYEDLWLMFGERGQPLGTSMLMNFELLEDSTATLFYDDCGFDTPVVIAYRWEATEDGWLQLYPGAGETQLRFMSDDDIGALRVHITEPCGELMFENDGSLRGWMPFYRGESCWVDRCTTSSVMQVDYCEGEEPPPCP
jgi:hypothetical protein